MKVTPSQDAASLGAVLSVEGEGDDGDESGARCKCEIPSAHLFPSPHPASLISAPDIVRKMHSHAIQSPQGFFCNGWACVSREARALLRRTGEEDV